MEMSKKNKQDKEELFRPEVVENHEKEAYDEILKKAAEQISQACQKYVSGLEKARVKSSIIENFNPKT